MKKHNEGYVLVFVLLVMMVLCLVALSIMSISLKNLQSQTASIQRMEEKYAAQGEAEKVVAQLLDISIESSAIEDEIKRICGEGNIIGDITVSSTTDSFASEFYFAVTKGSVKVTCGVTLAGKIDGTTTITEALTYNSYEIAEGEVSGG